PRCPCSRFNLPQFTELARSYGDRIGFGVVVLSPDEYTIEEIQEKMGMDLPVTFDRSLAEACGVYSTPQAVLMDADHKLYYRGNYNKSRYCADRATNYAHMAIDSLLGHHTELHPDRAALVSYGCDLTNCRK
ncbi:MAG TPA: AhpC/TSA family protein, partial [Flavobacteriales bacterium]|nr:AhpC/TSA family protein [Flavobacteriales bacterium]